MLILASGIFSVNVLTSWKEKTIDVKSADIEKSVNKSLRLLENSGQIFINRSKPKCVSCHHNTLTSMVAEKAKQKGIPVTDSLTASRVATMEETIKNFYNINLPDQFISAKFIGPYLLLAMAAEKCPPSANTDIVVDYLAGQQIADGSFQAESGRVPLESGEAHLTAMTIRAIQLYASSARKAYVNQVVSRAKYWLENTHPDIEQELAFQLLGMHWCGSTREMKQTVVDKLKSMQRPDGGWSQLPTMSSDAYATGQVLYALYESGMMQSQDETYQKGISYLLKTQDESGAWILESRSYPIQPYFSSDFPPYNENQFISATATNWASLALLEALPDKIN
jgi:hypothetical protein